MIQNPILRGFCPDPSIIRVENDYYIATSTFEWWPGVCLWHSRDLAHWEQLPSPLRRTSQLNLLGELNNCGVWAPDLSYADGVFYLVYTDVKTQKRPFYNVRNYVVHTFDIRGEWSNPSYLNSTGFDPSLFHDDDGRAYLINMRNGFKGILLQEYDTKNETLRGEVHTLFTGSSAGLTEGPHLYKKNGWYYLFTAEGGTGYEHQETLARSRTLLGTYELMHEPLITTKNKPDVPLQKAGHGQLVETPTGEPYFVHLCSRPIDVSAESCKRSPLGRETAVQKLAWTSDGWLTLAGGENEPCVRVPQPSGTETKAVAGDTSNHDVYAGEVLVQHMWRDDFDLEDLSSAYRFLRQYPAGMLSLTDRVGYLRLYGQESITSNYAVSLVALRRCEINSCAETCMEFFPICPEQVAGLSLLYNNENFCLLFLSAEDAVDTTNENGGTYLSLLQIHKAVYKNADPAAAGKIPVRSGRIFLRCDIHSQTGQFYYSYDGCVWIAAFDSFDVTLFSDEYCGGFTGSHFALYCHDMTGLRRAADFDYFALTENEA